MAIHIGFKGSSTGGSDSIATGWQWIRSKTHLTMWWSLDKNGVYRSGGLRPIVTLRTQGWWRYLMIGAVMEKGAFSLILGPVLIEWEPAIKIDNSHRKGPL